MLALLVHRLHHGTDDPGKHRTTARAASKTPGLSASKMVPSIIGEDLTIRGNVTSKGELQVDGEIEGDIRCGSLLLGDKAHVRGGVVAEDVVVRGHIVGSIAGALQGQCHVEGDILSQTLAIEQGAYFEGKSRRSDNPLAEIKAPGANGSASSEFREFTERGVSRRGGIANGCCRRSRLRGLLSKADPTFPARKLHALVTPTQRCRRRLPTRIASPACHASPVFGLARPRSYCRGRRERYGQGALVRSRKLECRE